MVLQTCVRGTRAPTLQCQASNTQPRGLFSPEWSQGARFLFLKLYTIFLTLLFSLPQCKFGPHSHISQHFLEPQMNQDIIQSFPQSMTLKLIHFFPPCSTKTYTCNKSSQHMQQNSQIYHLVLIKFENQTCKVDKASNFLATSSLCYLIYPTIKYTLKEKFSYLIVLFFMSQKLEDNLSF